MILSSTTRESVNGHGPFDSGRVRPEDPTPYQNRFDGSRWADDGYSPELRDPDLLRFVPRPGFRAPANPVLVEFRVHVEKHRLYIPSEADHWLFGFASFDTFGGFKEWDSVEHIFHILTTALPEHIEHARKVLTRLIQITSTERFLS